MGENIDLADRFSDHVGNCQWGEPNLATDSFITF